MSNNILAFLAGFTAASAVAVFYIYLQAVNHIKDLEAVREAGRRRGYAEGYQRKAFSAFAPMQ